MPRESARASLWFIKGDSGRLTLVFFEVACLRSIWDDLDSWILVRLERVYGSHVKLKTGWILCPGFQSD